MEQGSGNNVINNYKGVMLCSRPNEAPASITQKPFCGRVVNRAQLGLVPPKQQQVLTSSPKKPRLQILGRHKKWLESFKKNVQSKKSQIQQSKKQQQQKFRRIKELAEQDRQRSKKMKDQYNQTAANVMNILDNDNAQLHNLKSSQLTQENLNKLNRSNELNGEGNDNGKIRNENVNVKENKSNNFKKKDKNIKPLWAQTQQQIQQTQQNQVDELLNFFSTNHVQDYAEDEQVKDILSNLKQKIQKLKEQEDWKSKEIQKIKEKKQRKQKQEIQNNSDEDDKYTHFSVQSEGRSVASERTQQKIEQLKAKKKQQQDWDKNTVTQKSSIAGIDEKIAKNIADEVLRNYPNMRGVHSNVSIRKLLEAEAAKVMNQPIARPVITTIVREKQKIDANNLPYLHRNPAI